MTEGKFVKTMSAWLVAVLVGATILQMACGDYEQQAKQEAQQDEVKRVAYAGGIVEAGRYVQDPRTDLCYLAYQNPYSGNMSYVTLVPCTDKVLEQVKIAKDAQMRVLEKK